MQQATEAAAAATSATQAAQAEVAALHEAAAATREKVRGGCGGGLLALPWG